MQTLLDTHQHLLYRNHFRYSWADVIPELAGGGFELDDYRAGAASAGITSSIFMETGVDDEYWHDESRFIVNLASKADSGIVGVVAGCRPESDPVDFDTWIDEIAVTPVVGFRRILHVEPDELSGSSQFLRNIRQLGRHGKTFDMCFLERQLPHAVALARRCDNTQLILDHCGIPDIASGCMESWKANIENLAALPHVVCKLSGLAAYCPADRPLRDAILPYIEFCIEAFGFQRLVWGSDWPVCNLATDVGTWASLCREVLAKESREVITAVLSDNARNVYGVST